jgi:hypothetical protein
MYVLVRKIMYYNVCPVLITTEADMLKLLKLHVYPHIYRFVYLKPITVLSKEGATFRSLK